MLYTSLTNKALRIAYEAHNGQYDSCNIPYIFHPFHLAEQMEDEVAVCTALLHDVVEDTSITFEDLEKNFPKEVIDALRLLTHDSQTDYHSTPTLDANALASLLTSTPIILAKKLITFLLQGEKKAESLENKTSGVVSWRPWRDSNPRPFA